MKFKYSIACIFLFLQLQTGVNAKNVDCSSNLNTCIESYLELLEREGTLSDEQYRELGEAHYKRGVMYKSIYFYSLDAALKTLENLDSDSDSKVNSGIYDFLKIRRESFLNNTHHLDEILTAYENTDLFQNWENDVSDNIAITSKDQIVANWYRKRKDKINCYIANDTKLKSFCEYFFLDDLNSSNYLRLERNVRDEIPTNRDRLIDYPKDRLVELVDYYHAQWVYDFSISYSFFKQIDDSRHIQALFQKRDWQRLSESNSDFESEPIKIIMELANNFNKALLNGKPDELVSIDSMLNTTNIEKLNFIILHLTEGLSSLTLRDHLFTQRYLEKFDRSRDIRRDDRVPRILLRTGIANISPRIMAMYLPQSNSKRPEKYGDHRIVLSSHQNFLNRGIGGENQAKSQLVELQKKYDNLSLLHFLVQLATKPKVSNNNTILTN